MNSSSVLKTTNMFSVFFLQLMNHIIHMFNPDIRRSLKVRFTILAFFSQIKAALVVWQFANIMDHYYVRVWKNRMPRVIRSARNIVST